MRKLRVNLREFCKILHLIAKVTDRFIRLRKFRLIKRKTHFFPYENELEELNFIWTELVLCQYSITHAIPVHS